jgi:hypothetical protein
MNVERREVPADRQRHEQLSHPSGSDAAILLFERLCLFLIRQRQLASSDAVELVEDVIATKREMMAEDADPRLAAQAIGVMRRLANSLAAADKQSLPVPALLPRLSGAVG